MELAAQEEGGARLKNEHEGGREWAPRIVWVLFGMSSNEGEYRDALPGGAAKGRGAGINPGNRFEKVRLHVLGEHLDEVMVEHADGVRVATRVYADGTKSVINQVDSPDLPFSWTVNPYRGCEHGCIYCYARPGHEYLGLSCGLDFESKILAKFDAPALLRGELTNRKWEGEPIVFSGVTDPYQPIEGKLRITRGCLEVCADLMQPVSLITKNRLITRDIDLFKELARHRAVAAAVSVTTLDAELSRKMEPRASTPRDRLRAIEELTAAGVPVAVMTAPIVPGLNDTEIPSLLEEAKKAGAVQAGYIVLRLPHQIKDVFLEWVAREFPDRSSKVENAIRGMRSGELYQSKFGERHRGTGPRADAIRDTFNVFAKRHGLAGRWRSLSSAAFHERRRSMGQMTLF